MNNNLFQIRVTGLLIEDKKILLVKQKVSSNRPSTNEFDKNPIHDVKMVDINKLKNYGFTEVFQDIVKKGFPKAGNYMGLKAVIGL
ncbi:hypothetical protein [Oceanirhabdus sp. W0125-5]|uniref:hypothetical protein n=1 Tax=Oceanirhabdus sp. W0125-5 TaxID=2999116 RepID=UPI0022F2F8CA|nr:hypothetical protein [Oceanirhabdus sp. W0125-5]WBW95763.1 hypothetical protein OW730_19005 [Oceanirhabdus sp. W0125-5]